MIERTRAIFAALMILAFPLALASQTMDSSHASRARISTILPTEGCAALSLLGDVSGGGGAGAAQDASIHGFNPANIDHSIAPCTDFYQFAMGSWLKKNPIPADRPAWGMFAALRDQNLDKLRSILEEAAKDKTAAPGSNWQKIGDFYGSCMDESAVEAAGLKPLQPELARIAAINGKTSLLAEIARLQEEGVNAAFAFGSEQDLKDSTEVIAGLGQGGLGLPERQYYVDDDDHSKQLRSAYVQHVTNMFKLMGDDDAKAAAEAQTVLNLETSLAKASTKSEDLRDPAKNYHRMDLAKLNAFTPHFSWDMYFEAIGAPGISSADIGQLDFFQELDAAVTSVPLSDWKIYLRWHLIHTAAPALPDKFVQENFSFYGKALTGAQQILPRWKRCAQATDTELGEALGQYYVQRYFPPDAKASALAMVKNLIAALHEDLATLDWMSPATRQKASEKLDLISLKIGYPDKWRDYSKFTVDRTSYAGNLLRGASFEFARDRAKIGKPVDRNQWDMTPPTVNAYYNPSMNEIVFPAGILQPPFFDPKADDAINYGGIGSVIGHEMTHGFDDQGAQFDGKGNLSNWWTADDLKNFQARGECISKQFESYEIEPGLHGNGKLEEGESIADLGGMTIAHAAFLKTLEGKPAPASIDGFTAEQRFFLGWAQIWAENYRPEYARLLGKTDPHPLDQFRANGAPSNTPAFAAAFGCPANSTMIRQGELRCRIW
jgi:putative endopeptidase